MTEFEKLFTKEEWNKIREGIKYGGRKLHDGIYDVTNIPFHHYNYKNPDEAKQFMGLHPEFVIANAYNTSEVILFATEPKKITKDIQWIGSGFNYGSTNLLLDCPKDILILAEDD